MRFRMRLLWGTSLLGLLLAISGCTPDFFRCETTLNSDGSLERAIYQDLSETPANAARVELWTKTTHAARLEDKDWSGPISALPIHAPDDGRPYFAAWGHFDDVSKVPRNFARSVSPQLPDSTLKLESERTDYGFVIEHHWRETLTDIVTLDDMRLARAELRNLGIQFARAVFDDLFGKRYDATELIHWLESEGTDWLNEMTDLVYDLGVRRQLEGDKATQSLAAICRRHGLVLQDERGTFYSGKESDRVIQEFAVQLLKKHLRHKDRRPLSETELEFVLVILREADIKAPDAPDGEARKSRFETAYQRVVEQRFGGQEQFDVQLKTLLCRILGLHVSQFFNSPTLFRHRVKMPGEVVETTGQLLSLNEIEWSFHDDEAFPHGYVMEARSLEVSSISGKLLPAKALCNREKQIRFVDHVKNNDELLKAVKDCSTQQSLSPLYRYRRVAEDDAHANALKLFEILGLPAATPPK